MKRFKVLQAYLVFIILILSVFLSAGCGSGGGSGHGDSDDDTSKAILTYSLNGVVGTVNETAKTISVTLPFGTNVTALVATFTHTGEDVTVGAVSQTSGTTANNFTDPVLYTVTAEDGSTAIYTVTVTLAPNSAKAILTYSFVGYSAYPGVIDEAAKTIAVTLPFGTDVTALTANFTTTGVSVKIGAVTQTSGATVNNFTTPKAYTVTAADSSTATYTVAVTFAPNTGKAILTYSFVGYSAYPGVIDEAAKTIAVTLPFGTNVTNLIANYTTTGVGVTVGAVSQTSGATANNFTGPVLYTVTAADATFVDYTVTVTLAPNPAKAILTYSFVGYSGYPGTINEAAKTIAVTLPFGTDVTALTANFTTTGVSVKIGAVTQTSGATMNDFTAPVTYRVTAADATFVDYVVTVTLAQNSAKAILTYSFAGYSAYPGIVYEATKTIDVNLPFETDVTTLIANYTTTGTNVSIDAVPQTSGATMNDFTAPVTYRVTAADASFVDYVVTVRTEMANLGAAAPFGNFGGGAGMTNTGNLTVMNGDIGTTSTANSSITGFHEREGNPLTDDNYTDTLGANSGKVTGSIYTCTNSTTGPNSAENLAPATANDAECAIATQASLDMRDAYIELAARPSNGDLAGNLADTTIYPGVYKNDTSVSITGGDVTLDAQGDANAVFVFQIGSTLTVGDAAIPRSVILAGNAQARNIFWQVGTAATINPSGGGTFEGTIIAYSGVTFSTAGKVSIVTLNGRALSLIASVTMVNTIINVPAH